MGGRARHDGCVIAATVMPFVAVLAARWGGKHPRMTAALSRQPLCLSTRFRRRDGGKRPRHGGSAVAATVIPFDAAWTARLGERLRMTAALSRRSYGLSTRLWRRDGGKRPRHDGCVSRRSYGLSLRLRRRDGGSARVSWRQRYRSDHTRLTAPLRPDGCRIPARRARGCSRARSSRRRGSADRGAFRGAPERRAACRARGR